MLAIRRVLSDFSRGKDVSVGAGATRWVFEREVVAAGACEDALMLR